MAVLRQSNFQAQQRIDLPHLRLIESAVAGDFDLLAGRMMGGKQPLILTGFTLGTKGLTQVTELRMQVADGMMIHYNASESGSIFSVPSDRPDEALITTNNRVVGQFAPSQVNYIGIDLVRKADDSTTDLVMFLNPSTLIEFAKEVPLARTLDYRIVITTVDFSSTPGIAPVAKVTTGANSEILAVTDARSLFFRLGSGGSAPNPKSSFSWPDGRREFQDRLTDNVFAGGDKVIGCLKTWCDAVMTRVWEIGGGEYWYTPTSDRNVRMVHAGPAFNSTGEHFEWTGGNLHWQGLRVLFDNSTGYYNEVADVTANTPGTTDLVDGDCIYVDLDRSQNRGVGLGVGGSSTALTAVKGNLHVLGPGVPGGSRIVLAWRHAGQAFTRDQGYPVNSAFKLAMVGANGYVKLSANDADTRVVTLTSSVAIAGGLSRGVGDFVGGIGDISIGGQANDRNILLYTYNNRYTKIYGSPSYLASSVATLEVQNIFGIPATLYPTNLIAAFKAKNLAGDLENVATIDVVGAYGYRSGEATPSTPVGGNSIRVKTFVQSIGTTPTKRDQFCIMWHDGTILVLAEGPDY